MTAKSSPFISICIPAYQRTHYLMRLLQSLSEQTFTDFEVIVSDDSRDHSVEQLIKQYEGRFSLFYYKNQMPFGTPANWNQAIAKAKGEWIKLMHDDDWLATPDALQQFANAAKRGKKFIVSGYNNIDDDGHKLRKPKLTPQRRRRLIKNPMLLLSENYIGQPSVVMVHRSVSAIYDERMKWRVDIDYYMQLLNAERDFIYLHAILINVGISSTQVTHSCLNVPGVELPEGWLLIEKYGVKSLNNVMVYDAWWRIIRNTGTRGKAALYQHASHWPKVIETIAERQSRIPSGQLLNGIYSKLFMLMSYLKQIVSD